MDLGRSRAFRVPVLVLACLTLATACKSKPTSEAPVTEPPVFEKPKPAEPVDDSGFKDAAPVQEPVRETAASLADRLNAQRILKPIYFEFDKYDLRPDAIGTLTDGAARIKENASLKIRIEGHCDERGTVEYNLALGEKRARAARDYLVSLGVPAARLRIISYGKERPADSGHSESAWAKNRRDEFLFAAD